MARRLPAPVRVAIAVLAAHSRAADVDLNGSHIKIRWIADDGRHRLLVLAHTPSDHRADINARCLLNRLLRQEQRR
jgi:hypothetical protein